jgi:hypothetical protein
MEVTYFLLTQEDMIHRMLHTVEVALSPQAHVPERDATPQSGEMTATRLQLRDTPRHGGGAAQAQHPGAVSLPQRRALS